MVTLAQQHRGLEHCKYWAFVSYSHKDAAWSTWLHRALESYSLPRRLVGRPAPDGPIPKRLFPIFRDTAELPAAGSLTRELREALRSSRYLIILCSPASARSAYVEEEIRFFKSLGRGDRVLSVILEGEPNASADPARAEQECFPQAVCHEVGTDGALLGASDQPIAADARPGKDSRRDVLLRLVAGVLGLRFDELKQRDHRRQLTRRFMGAGALLAVVVALTLTWQWQEVQKRHQAIESYTSMGQQELSAGNESKAAVYLAEAYRLGGHGVRQRMLLAPALQPLDLQGKQLATGGGPVRLLAFDRAGGRFVSLVGSSQLRLWDGEGNLVATLEDGDARIEAATFSPDGRYLLTCALDRLVRLWDTTSGVLLARLPDHPSLLNAVAFSPDNEHFATIGSDGSAVVWTARAEEGRWSAVKLKAPVAVRPPAVFSANGERLATRGWIGNTVFLWDTGTGQRVDDARLEFRSTVVAVGFSEPYVAVALQDGTLEIINSNTGQRSGPLGSGPSPAVFLAQVGTEPSFVLVKDDGHVELWDAVRKQKQREFVTGLTQVKAVGFDGRRLVLVANEPVPTFSVWDLTSSSHVATAEALGEQLTHAALAPGLEVLVTGGVEGTLRTWDLARRDRDVTLSGHRAMVHLAEFSPDGSKLVTSGSEGGATVWDPKTGRILDQLEHEGSAIYHARFDPRGSRLVTLSSEGEIGLWDAERYTLLSLLPKLDAKDLTVAPRGNFLVALQLGDAVFLWWPDEGRAEVLDRPKLAVTRLTFSSDGALLAVGNADGSVELWDTEKLRSRQRLWSHREEITSLSFSGDGRRLLTTAKDGMAIVWSPGEGRELKRLVGHAGAVLAGQLSQDGRTAVTAGADYSVKLWDTERGKVRGSLDDHADAVTQVALTPDGSVLATGADDRTVKLWETASGKLIRTLPPHGGRILAVAFDRTGELLATAAADSMAQVWDMRLEARSPEEVTRLLNERSTLTLEKGKLVARAPAAGSPGVASAVDEASRATRGSEVATSPETLATMFVAALAEGDADQLAQLISSDSEVALRSLSQRAAEDLKQFHELFSGATVTSSSTREDGRAALVTLKVAQGVIDLTMSKTEGGWQLNGLLARKASDEEAAVH